MKKIKNLFKGSPIAMIVAGLLIAGIASAALLTIYGHTTGTANVQQSVLFGDGTTTKTYEVGNSDPVAGNVYYELETLVNHASDKPADIQLNTSYQSSAHNAWWPNEDGITTSYMQWVAPQVVLTGERPTVVYNSTGSKKYEVWYKTSGASYLRYANYDSAWHIGGNTNVSSDYDCPFVMKENGKYYMVNYGSSSEKEFYIYTSDDGISWNKGPEIYADPHTNFEKIDNPKLLKDETGYKMYFQAKNTDGIYSIHLATSDAKNLEEIAGGDKYFNYQGSVLQPGAEGEWDSYRVMQPMVFKPGNKGYLMLYTGYDKYDMKGKIGYAVSNDGISWTKVKASKEGYDTNLGTDAWKTSVVKTNNNLVLFYQNNQGGSKIDWTWLSSVVDSNSQMTIQPQEIKPFFIENDFAINLEPRTYSIKTDIIPVTQ